MKNTIKIKEDKIEFRISVNYKIWKDRGKVIKD